jgi:hypothetical protein
MVKGVSRSTGGGSSSTGGASPAPQQLPTMQTGQNVHDPLTQLNGHMGFGAMAGLNPFGELGLNQNDPNMVCVFDSSFSLGPGAAGAAGPEHSSCLPRIADITICRCRP